MRSGSFLAEMKKKKMMMSDLRLACALNGVAEDHVRLRADMRGEGTAVVAPRPAPPLCFH